jgi:hypothetical protein
VLVLGGSLLLATLAIAVRVRVAAAAAVIVAAVALARTFAKGALLVEYSAFWWLQQEVRDTRNTWIPTKTYCLIFACQGARCRPPLRSK